MLKNIDADGPAQEAVQKAAAMTAEVEGLDNGAPVDEVAQRLDGKVSPAVLAMAKALVVQAGGLGTVTKAVEGFGWFAKQYEQIEKVSAHHGDSWEVLLYGQIGRDRAVIFERAGCWVLGAGRARARPATPWCSRRVHHHLRRGGGGRHFLRHAELAQGGEQDPYGAVRTQALQGDGPHRACRGTAHRRCRSGRLGGVRGLVQAVAAVGGREGGVGASTWSRSACARRASVPRRSDWSRRSRPECRSAPDGGVARIGYWRIGGSASARPPARSQNWTNPSAGTSSRSSSRAPTWVRTRRPGTSRESRGYELSCTANRHFFIVMLNEAIADLVKAHARPDISQAWGDGTAVAADGTHMDTYLENLLFETSVRYGKPGDIAYHHISDTNIAWSTHFVLCGV